MFREKCGSAGLFTLLPTVLWLTVVDRPTGFDAFTFGVPFGSTHPMDGCLDVQNRPWSSRRSRETFSPRLLRRPSFPSLLNEFSIRGCFPRTTLRRSRYQPTHPRVVSRADFAHWDTNLGEPLLLAAEQHDIGWIDRETTPTFDPRTGRPHLFRDVGVSVHAPMWSLGVRRALDA
jgi:hypothetical protein